MSFWLIHPEKQVKPPKPVRKPAARVRKLTMERAREIRAKYAAGGISMSAIGREYGVNQAVVSHIVHNINYREPVDAEKNQQIL